MNIPYWIVYKKTTRDFKEFILELAVPYYSDIVIDCHGIARVDEAFVLRAENLTGKPVDHQVFHSLFDWNFQYRIGETVESPHQGSKGIFCFVSKDDARKFMNR